MATETGPLDFSRSADLAKEREALRWQPSPMRSSRCRSAPSRGPMGRSSTSTASTTDYITPALEAAGLEVFRADQESARRRHPHRHVPGAAGRRPGGRRPDDRQSQRLVRARRAPCAARARRGAGQRRTRDRPPSTSTPIASCATASRTARPTPPRSSRTSEQLDRRWSRRRWSRGTAARSARSTTCCRTCRSRTGSRCASATCASSGSSTTPGRAASSCAPQGRTHRRPAGAGRTRRRSPRSAREAWIKAGEALRRAERFDFALEHLERGLEIEPANLEGLREKGICLQRLALPGAPGHSLDRAREHYRQRARSSSRSDPETWALLGRVDKDAWIAAWRRDGRRREQMRDDAGVRGRAAARGDRQLHAGAIARNPSHYYSGINALTLMHLYRHLTGDTRYDAGHGDAWPAPCASRRSARPDAGKLFWSKATLGDLEVLVGTPETVKDSLQGGHRQERQGLVRAQLLSRAAAAAEGPRLPPDDRRGRHRHVRSRARAGSTKPADRWQPRQVLLFSGHMIDAPGREPSRASRPTRNRSPRSKIAAGARRSSAPVPRISRSARPRPAATCCSSRPASKRGVRCQVLLPFPEPEFIERSILPSAGGDAGASATTPMKAKLAGPDADAHHARRARSAAEGRRSVRALQPLAALHRARRAASTRCASSACGTAAAATGPGGTAHMYNEVKRRTGRVTWIDTRTAW